MANEGSRKKNKVGDITDRTPPLPVWRALRRSIMQVVEHRKAAFSACLPWFLTSIPLYVVAGFLSGAWDSADPDANLPWTGAVILMAIAVCLFAVPRVALVWHRYALLGETIPRSLGVTNSRSWAYSGNVLRVVFVAAITTIFIIGMIQVAITLPTTGLFSDIVFVGVLFCGMVAAGSLAMTLPSSALGRGADIDMAIEMERGNIVRIALCLGLCLIGIGVVLAALHGLLARMSAVADLIVCQATLFAGSIVVANVLNNIYVWCDGRGPKDEVLSI